MVPAIIGAAAWALPLILKYGPGLVTHLAGPRSGDIANKAADLIQSVTGTTDPQRAAVVLADPAKATDVSLQLAQLQSDAEAAKRRDELEQFKAELVDTQSARSQTIALAQAGSKISWAAPTISIVIVSGFFFVPLIAYWVGVTVDQIWMGALIAAFGAVWQYWLGASASGRRAQEAVAEVARQSAETSNATISAASRAATEVVKQVAPVVATAPVVIPTIPAATPVADDYSNEWEQSPFGGVRFKLTADGVLVEGETKPARTVGEPVTVRRIWKDFGPYIQQSCKMNGVPLELVVACIATESRGVVDAVYTEPDGRKSTGLMQILPDTADQVMGRPVSAQELSMPEIGIEAGTRYIKLQYKKTKFLPPFVAAAYNSGGIYPPRDQDTNKWNLRSTKDHISRFCLYFNDAAFVAKQDNWSH